MQNYETQWDISRQYPSFFFSYSLFIKFIPGSLGPFYYFYRFFARAILRKYAKVKDLFLCKKERLFYVTTAVSIIFNTNKISYEIFQKL